MSLTSLVVRVVALLMVIHLGTYQETYFFMLFMPSPLRFLKLKFVSHIFCYRSIELKSTNSQNILVAVYRVIFSWISVNHNDLVKFATDQLRLRRVQVSPASPDSLISLEHDEFVFIFKLYKIINNFSFSEV